MGAVLINCVALDLSREEIASIIYECIKPSTSRPDVPATHFIPLSERGRSLGGGGASFFRLQMSLLSADERYVVSLLPTVLLCFKVSGSIRPLTFACGLRAFKIEVRVGLCVSVLQMNMVRIIGD
jgi:hypothetical protein